MGHKSSKRGGGGRGRKLSRFSLGRKGEIALAAVGVLILVGAVALIWVSVSSRLLPPDPQKASREKAEAATLAARWETLQREGVVLSVDLGRQNVSVDPSRWEAMLPTERGLAAEAICVKNGLSQCIVYDPAGRRLGWYTRADGYHGVPKGSP